MSSEQPTPAEELLQRYAARRREQAEPLELHSATRRMLQAEVSRFHRRRLSVGNEVPFRSLFWIRLRLIGSTCALLALLTWAVLDFRQRGVERQNLAKNTPAPARRFPVPPPPATPPPSRNFTGSTEGAVASPTAKPQENTTLTPAKKEKTPAPTLLADKKMMDGSAPSKDLPGASRRAMEPEVPASQPPAAAPAPAAPPTLAGNRAGRPSGGFGGGGMGGVGGGGGGAVGGGRGVRLEGMGQPGVAVSGGVVVSEKKAESKNVSSPTVAAMAEPLDMSSTLTPGSVATMPVSTVGSSHAMAGRYQRVEDETVGVLGADAGLPQTIRLKEDVTPKPSSSDGVMTSRARAVTSLEKSLADTEASKFKASSSKLARTPDRTSGMAGAANQEEATRDALTNFELRWEADRLWITDADGSAYEGRVLTAVGAKDAYYAYDKLETRNGSRGVTLTPSSVVSFEARGTNRTRNALLVVSGTLRTADIQSPKADVGMLVDADRLPTSTASEPKPASKPTGSPRASGPSLGRRLDATNVLQMEGRFRIGTDPERLLKARRVGP